LIFSNINIRGGICYLLWDKQHDNSKDLTNVYTYNEDLNPTIYLRSLKTEGSDILIRHNRAIEITEKVKLKDEFKSFENYVSSLRPFGFREYFTKDKKFRKSKDGLKIPIICYGKGKQVGYLEKDEINKNEDWIKEYKVYTARANNI